MVEVKMMLKLKLKTTTMMESKRIEKGREKEMMKRKKRKKEEKFERGKSWREIEFEI